MLNIMKVNCKPCNLFTAKDDLSLWPAQINVLIYGDQPTLRLGTWTTSPYWSLVMTVTIAGQPHLISSRLYSTSQRAGSTYESGCNHRESRPPLVPEMQCTKSFKNSRSLEW